MKNYCQTDFCDAELGLDYIFAKLGGIYGASFIRQWENVDATLVRQTWGEMLGNYATYRPNIDWALRNLDESFVPSAIKFRNLCHMAGNIPKPPVTAIHTEKTQEEKDLIEVRKQLAIQQLRDWSKSIVSH